MKNRKNKNAINVDHSILAITTTLAEPILLKDIVEKLAYRRYDVQYSHEKVQVGWQAIETSSLEAYVSGAIDISCKTDFIHMPFTTCFLFTCIKTKGGKNNLTWASSLS